MTASELMQRMSHLIDGHRWDELPALVHPGFTCRYVHTGEILDGEGWVRLNAEYPGFQRFALEDLVDDGDRAAGRAHVTGLDDEGELQHFEVAMFLTERDGMIADLTEVWTDVGQSTPPGTRPWAEEGPVARSETA